MLRELCYARSSSSELGSQREVRFGGMAGEHSPVTFSRSKGFEHRGIPASGFRSTLKRTCLASDFPAEQCAQKIHSTHQLRARWQVVSPAVHESKTYQYCTPYLRWQKRRFFTDKPAGAEPDGRNPRSILKYGCAQLDDFRIYVKSWQPHWFRQFSLSLLSVHLRCLIGAA